MGKSISVSELKRFVAEHKIEVCGAFSREKCLRLYVKIDSKADDDAKYFITYQDSLNEIQETKYSNPEDAVNAYNTLLKKV